MKARNLPNTGFRLLLLVGMTANFVGCTIHHYHHIETTSDSGVRPETIAQLVPVSPVRPVANRTALPVMPKAMIGLPEPIEAMALGNKSIEDSGIVRASYQEPAAKADAPKLLPPVDPETFPQPGKNHASQDAKAGTADAWSSTGSMTFDQAVHATLVADPKIRAGLESIRQANADFLTASLFPNPSLLTDGIFLPLRRWTADAPGGPPQIDVQLSYGIDWFLFGKRAAGMASAQLGVRQSESDYADLVRQRVTTTSTAFYDVLEAKALVDLAAQDVDNLTKLAAATKKATEAGGRPMVELYRVRLDLLKSEQALREAESTYSIAKAKLRSLFGRTDPDPSFDVLGNLDAPLVAEPMSLEDAYATAQLNRPDIASLRWQVTKAEADVNVENRKAYPQITTMVGLSRQYQGLLGQPDASSMDVSVQTTLPIFDRNQGNRAKARSVVAQNNLNLQAGIVDLRAEVAQTLNELELAYRNANAVALEHLKLAAQVRDGITEAYNAGGRPLIDVLDAQRNYRETYRAYINSRANYWRSVYKFSSAIGKQVVQP
jgi:cobalt-zinc-cadmium efflux system outer membrane protein